MILDSGFERCIKEVPFVDQKIEDYFSPQGTFPEKMYLAEELREKTYQVPEGYTEEDCRALLVAVTCSDRCMEGTRITGSSSPNQMADPRKNEIMRQLLMMMTNSLCCDDFKRQKGVSEAYVKGRSLLPELFGQLAENNLTETRKLFSEGVKNMLLVQRSMWKEIQAKPEDYSSYRITEMALDFLKKHPEMRDSQILEDADMEEIPIFRGKMAFYKEALEKGRVCNEKTKNGERLTEDEIAEVILLNQIFAVSRRESDQRRDEVYAEYLKQEKLPGGIPMPIGQRFQELVGCARNYDNGSIELRQILGPLELEKYKMALEGRSNEAVTTQGYGDFTRAVAAKYPENREILLEKVKQSDYFREVLQKEGKDLVNALDTVKDMGVFTREDTLELLEKEGLRENPVTYHVETIPENRAYAEALEAERRGENIHSEKWEQRFRKMVETENALINREKKEREKVIKVDILSDQLKHRLRGSDENWCTELLRTEDALTELLTNGSRCIFLLRPDGSREYLIPKPDGSDLEQLKERCLEAETNGIFIQAPAGAETKNEVMAVRLDMENEGQECKMEPLQEYIHFIESEPLPERPSLWKRILAFFISDYREEIEAYEAAVRDRENAEKLKSVKEAVHREHTEQTAESVRDLDEENNLYVEKMLQAGDEKLDDALERENRKTAETLRVDKFCENLVKCIKEKTGTKPEPKIAVLAFINSMQPSGDPMEMYRNRTYTEQVLTGSNILNDEEKTRLARGYLDLEERVENDDQLLTGDKLRCFLNTLMHPETAVTAFGVGAAALETLGEAGIKEALNLDKNKKLTPEICGILEYGKICQKSSEICDTAAEKAKTEPDAKLSEEDVLTVLITDCIDRERTVTRNVSSVQENELLTTPLLKRLGKKGMEDFREEVRKAVGDDYLKQQAAKGNRKFVENHRNTLGVLGEKSLSKQIGGHRRQKATTNLEKTANSIKK